MTKYINFGWSCIIPSILSIGRLSTHAWPFDFVYAVPCHIKSSLDLDFANWLEDEHFSFIETHDGRPRKTFHAEYNMHPEEILDDHGVLYPLVFFFHHDMSITENKGKFVRRFNKYREAIASDEDIIFITDNPIESTKECGLDTYYADRKAKTTIVYIQRIKSDIEFVNLEYIDNNWIIRYWHEDEVDRKTMSLIADYIRVVAEKVKNSGDIKDKPYP
jgi:hypothetical protein